MHLASNIAWTNKQSILNKETSGLMKEFWKSCTERKTQVSASYRMSIRKKVDSESRKTRENLK